MTQARIDDTVKAYRAHNLIKDGCMKNPFTPNKEQGYLQALSQQVFGRILSYQTLIVGSAAIRGLGPVGLTSVFLLPILQ